uniref:Branched-chain amino acid transport system ATP-binding protein/urea transport system ATP-binding protein n=1 Tax=Candidatus Kentrum sp. DK TaxID=2126562 RepID=A0A450S7Y0_9GAMM|nr:MAG: branched-chain amino acid transport system ATP-binding protein/urea transport system ATP-binding protein [Candidatus Kentron sp. DK]
MTCQLRTKNLSVGYGGQVVIDDISLTFSPDEITLVIGPNGAGKSTLLKAMVGEIKPWSGSVNYSGHQAGLKHLAYLPQADNVFLQKTVLKNLMVGKEGRFRSTSRERGIVERFVEENFPILLERLSTPVHRLSGGLIQMTALARTILMDRPFTLLDEPTRGLSEGQLNEIFPMIRRLLKNSSKGVIIVEHKIDLTLPICDRLIILRGGKVSFDGPTKGIRGLRDVKEYYF